MANQGRDPIGRRSFLLTTGSLAAVPFMGGVVTRALAESAGSSAPAATRDVGRRKLGALEVSSVGLGVRTVHSAGAGSGALAG